MHSKRTTSRIAGMVLGASLAITFPGLAQIVDGDFSRFLMPTDTEEEYWPRHFRVGAFVGLNIKANFSMSGTFKFSQNNPGATGSGGVDRIYDDGYVRVDANGTADNSTWNWGYQNPGQTNTPQQLLFHAADSYTASGNAAVSGDAQVGFETTYGGQMTRWGSALVGWEFGFGFLPINIKDDRTITGVSATQITHSFDASGIVIPDAPYAGTYNGPGALISDVAQFVSGNTYNDRTLTGERKLDVNLYSFRLGPTFQWEFHPRFALAVSGGAAVGIVSGQLKFNEAVRFPDGSTAVNVGSYSSTELTYGGYLSAALLFHAVKNGDFYIGAQYMPMSNATFSGGGREATLDLTGSLYLSVGINWPF